LALKHGDFIAELLDGFFKGMHALVEQVDNPQQGFDTGSVRIRNGGRFKSIPSTIAKGTLLSCASFQG